MEGGHVRVRAGKSDDGAGAIGREVWVKHVKAAAAEGWNEPRPFAQQFGADLVEAELEEQFQGGMESDHAEEVVRSGLITPGIVPESELWLSDEIGAGNIVPAEDGGMEFVLERTPDEQDSGGAGTEEPFVGVGGEEVEVFGWSGKSAEGLDRVDTEADVAFAEGGAEGGEIEAWTGNKMARGERHEPGSCVHLVKDILALDQAEGRGAEKPDFDVAGGQCLPGINIGRIVFPIDQHIIAGFPWHARGDQAQAE